MRTKASFIIIGRYIDVIQEIAERRWSARSVVILLILLPAACCWGRASGPEVTTAGPGIQPIHAYLMDRDAEIKLAMSAAPVAIAREAEVLVLTADGYRSVRSGRNGFVCLVERGWMNAFEDAEFGSPKLLSPMCLNEPASRTRLPLLRKRTALAVKGTPIAGMKRSLQVAFDQKELSPPVAGSMCYMMSPNAYFGRSAGRAVPHIMFFFPSAPSGVWGAGLAGSPVFSFDDAPDKTSVVIVGVGHWSDGSAFVASGDAHHH